MRTRIKNKQMKRQLYEWHVAMLRLYGAGDQIKSYRKWLKSVSTITVTDNQNRKT
jgi:hypothetical protein